MTILAHNAAVNGVQIDIGRLYDGDPGYEQWAAIVVEQVSATNRKAADG